MTQFITETFDQKRSKLTIEVDLLALRTEILRIAKEPLLASKLLWWKGKKDGKSMPTDLEGVRLYDKYSHMASGFAFDYAVEAVVGASVDYSVAPEGIPAPFWAVLTLAQKKQFLSAQAK